MKKKALPKKRALLRSGLPPIEEAKFKLLHRFSFTDARQKEDKKIREFMDLWKILCNSIKFFGETIVFCL